jgi:hypothetical protein
LGLLHLSGVSVNDAQCDGIEQHGVPAVVALDLYQGSDAGTGTVIAFIELSDLDEG